MLRPATRLLAAIPLLLLLAGCGLVRTSGGGAVRIQVTENFGARTLASAAETLSRPADAPSVLARKFQVSGPTGHPHAIAGHAAPPGSGWFLYINGVSPVAGAAHSQVHPGDRVWWDLHSTAAQPQLHAIVGAFPEPFVHGVGGKRLPVTLECAGDTQVACTRVSHVLTAIGIPSVRQVLGTGSGQDTLGVVVGTDADLRAEVVAVLIDYGPGASGVYGRFVARGADLELLNADGRVARRLGAGAGLVAATGDVESEPTWLITGTDPAGVAAAAAALDSGALHDHFALAVQGKQLFPLPLGSG